ncbi:MAG: HD domain-containing protein [Thermoleophilia bacterium]|nr:HD domain-containing protein [Thermoleophilia bacterium]
MSVAVPERVAGRSGERTTVASLVEDRIVEGVFAVARKRRLTTRAGRPYLALELVDRTGHVEGRVWSDVELLDARFREGDAVRVLARVERFRDRLQLDVRSVEPADTDASSLVPESHRDLDELDGYFEFLAAEVSHPGLAEVVANFVADGELRARLRSLPATPTGHHSYAGGLLEHTVAVATLCREAAELHRRLRRDLLVTAALLHDVGRTRELGPGPIFRATTEGALLGHVHLGVRIVEQRAGTLPVEIRAELLHAVASHHDARAAQTAEALVVVHANALDAAAATRRVETPER